MYGDFSVFNNGVATTTPQYYICNFNIVNTSNNQTLFSNKIMRYPTLDNSTEDLQNLSFNNFNVSANDFSNEDIYMLFYNRSLSNSQNTDGLYPISEKLLAPESIYYDVENSTSNNAKYTVPIWKTGVLFNVGSTYEIRFATLDYNPEYNTTTYNYIGNTYQFTISSNVTQDYINQLNQQTATDTSQDNFNNINNSINKQSDAINNQTNAINNQTQSIDNINSSITNSTVDNSSIDLPTDNTTDPTQNGVDNIFQTIYNSFTSGTAQDIVFPIPFTDKSIILQANYLYNVLQNNNASWVVMIIQAFWWYLISRFIIKDIMKKIRKIKQGNLDNIQNDNIKEDML